MFIKTVEVGDIASCQQGQIGLVLKVVANPKTGIMYSGIRLGGKDFGKS